MFKPLLIEDMTGTAVAGVWHRYKSAVFKVTLGISFKREIVWFSTLSLGASNDSTIALEELDGPSGSYRYPWEWILADGGLLGCI